MQEKVPFQFDSGSALMFRTCIHLLTQLFFFMSSSNCMSFTCTPLCMCLRMKATSVNYSFRHWFSKHWCLYRSIWLAVNGFYLNICTHPLLNQNYQIYWPCCSTLSGSCLLGHHLSWDKSMWLCIVISSYDWKVYRFTVFSTVNDSEQVFWFVCFKAKTLTEAKAVGRDGSLTCMHFGLTRYITILYSYLVSPDFRCLLTCRIQL